MAAKKVIMDRLYPTLGPVDPGNATAPLAGIMATDVYPMFRALLQSLYDAVLITNSTGRIREANQRAEKLVLFSAAELVQMRTSQLVAGLDEKLLSQMSENLKKGRFTVLDASCYRRDGTMFPAEIAVSRLLLNNEESLVFSIRNIKRRIETEDAIRKEAEGQMARAKTQDDFSGLLHIISLPDLFQLIASSRKSGSLSVYDSEHNVMGTIVFGEGEIVHATQGTARGEPAVFAMIQARGESFEFKQGAPVERDESISRGTMGLLLEAARVIDEDQDSE